MSHEGLVTLFRECPDLAIKLAGPRFEVPADASAQVTSAELSCGPELIPVIVEPTEAAELPELAVLSVAAHGDEPDAMHIALAALAAAARLDNRRSALYADLVHTFLGKIARQALEALMQAGKYEYQSEFARKYFNQGEERGEVRGEAKGLLKILAARGFEVPVSLRDHVLSCSDRDLIEQWYERAFQAERLENIFDPALLA